MNEHRGMSNGNTGVQVLSGMTTLSWIKRKVRMPWAEKRWEDNNRERKESVYTQAVLRRPQKSTVEHQQGTVSGNVPLPRNHRAWGERIRKVDKAQNGSSEET